MAKKKKDVPEQGMEIDLTPMIDVTFQLIIFFMVVTEIQALDNEELTLPMATRTEKQEKKPAADMKRMTISVVKKRTGEKEDQRGAVKIRGREYDKKALEELLKIEALSMGLEPNENDPNHKVCNRIEIMIRGDKEVEFLFVQRVFDACIGNGIWKTSLVATPATKK